MSDYFKRVFKWLFIYEGGKLGFLASARPFQDMFGPYAFSLILSIVFGCLVGWAIWDSITYRRV